MTMYETSYRCWTVGAVQIDGQWHPLLDNEEGAATAATADQAVNLAILAADTLDGRAYGADQRRPYAEILYGDEPVVIRYANGYTFTALCVGVIGPALERPCQEPAEVMVGSTSLCRSCAAEMYARAQLDAEHDLRLATA